MRIGRDVREVADKSSEGDQGQVADQSQEIFDVVAEDKKEIHVSNKVNDAGVKKKCGEKREPSQSVACAGIKPNFWAVS